MATRKLRGYSLVMKPDRSSGGKTLKIYGVYEDVGGKACIQRVSEVDENFKKKIRELLEGEVVPDKEVVVPGPGNGVVVPVKGNEIGANINSPGNNDFYNNEFNLLNNDYTVDNITPKISSNIQTPPEENKEIKLEYYEQGVKNILSYMEQLKTQNPNNKNIIEIIKEINNIIGEESFKEKINSILIDYYKLRYLLQNNKSINYNTNTNTNIVVEDETLSKSIYEIIGIYFFNANVSLDITEKTIIEQMNAYFKKIHDNSKINDFQIKINGKEIKGHIFAEKIYTENISEYLLNQNENSYPFIFVHYNEPTAISETENNTTELAIATSVANNSTTTPDTVFRIINKGGKTQRKRLPKKRSIVFSRRK